MIVSFFVFISYMLDLVKSKFNSENITIKAEHNIFSKPGYRDLVFEGEAEVTDCRVQFFPPAYLQRYRAVVDVINFHKKQGDIKKVVDFGCSNLAFFNYLKHLEGIEEYIGVDIDKVTLENNYSRTSPLQADYLSKRHAPLKVFVFRGSVSEPDIRLKDSNVVIAIELIEHMYPNELNDLPYNIFGVIQPELAIFTTPNSDFNILFPNFTGFRHPDHKFEWSREEFEDWANNVTMRYPSYDVSFHGIGKGTIETQRLGCCSQMAIFVRNTDKVNCFEKYFNEVYECIYEVEYPYETLEQKLINTLEYELHQFVTKVSHSEKYVVEDHREVPLDTLVKELHVECSTDRLLEFLKTTDYEVKWINNKENLILPFFPLDDDDLSYDDDIPSEDNIQYDEDDSHQLNSFETEEYWDDNTNHEDISTMKSNEFVEEESKGKKTPPVNASASKSTDMLGCSASGTVSSKNNCDIEPVKCKPDILNHYKTNLGDEKEPNDIEGKCKSTGTIPKKLASTTSASSDEAEPSVGLVRCSGLVNIHDNSRGLSQQIVSSDYENSSQESFMERVSSFSSSSTDTLKSYSFIPAEKYIRSSSHEYLKPSSSGSQAPALSLRTSDKLNGKLIRCQQCSQTYLNKHVCLGFGTPSNDKVLEIKNTTETTKTDEKPFNGSSSDNVEQPGPSSVYRSHSLGNVNAINGKSKNFRYSLNIDNEAVDCDTCVVDMDLEVCCKVSSVPSLTDTFGSHSKAADSGYPNSVHDMDLDLTPEQVDEIITETESSLEDEDSSADEVAEQVPGNPPLVFLDNVENGDVANNNRDGEGNNMEGGENVEEVLNFEGIVLEEDDIEADQHESEDEGLFLSALDVSNETLVPEESLSCDETVFNSMFEGPSSCSVIRVSEVDDSPQLSAEESNVGFPSWLLNMLVNEALPEGGDSGTNIEPLVLHVSASDESSSVLLVEDEAEVQLTVPVDIYGGGDSSSLT